MMAVEESTKLGRIDQRVGEIHAALFGVEGQGGLHRRVEAVEKDVEALKSFHAKTIGIAAAVTSAVTLFGGKLLGLIK